MASPFTVFRKNQKMMLAVLTLLAMFGFVFLPILGDALDLRGRGHRDNVVVKTTKYGNLKESDVDRLLRQRRGVLQALGALIQLGGASPEETQRALNAYIGMPTEEGVVNAWLLARRAEELGMVVSDEAIVRFLKMLTNNKVKPDAFQAVLKQAGFNGERHFLDAMRSEVAVLDLNEMSRFSLFGLTPAQRWDYFKRLNQMAKIEAAAVPVARYADRVQDPSEEELKKFFEDHKAQQLPTSSKPSFYVPHRVALEYLKADMEAFGKKVTDAEILARYEKNKSEYDEMDKKADSATAPQSPAKGTSDTIPLKENGPDTAKSAAPAKAEDNKKPAEPAKDDKKGSDKKDPEKKANGTSAIKRSSPFRLTAMLQESKAEDKAAGKAEPSTEKKAEAPKPVDAAKAPAATTEKKSEPEKKAEAKPAAAKTGPSDAVKNRIRREIARERIQADFEKLRGPLEAYQQQWNAYNVKRIAAESAKDKSQVTVPTPPAKPDFDALAKQYGFTAGRTELMSQWQARSSEIGGSMAVTMTDGNMTGIRGMVAQYAFTGLAKFKPAESFSFTGGGDLYLFWKTEDEKERIPEFTDAGVREHVLATWKMIHARPDAIKQAESLAAEAAKSRKPLKEFFANQSDVQVITPPAFSWNTTGSVPLGSAPEAVRISDVEGITMPGDDFMRAVFHIENVGDTGAAFNEPKTAAYVIRLVELTPSEDKLWDKFKDDDFTKYAAAAQMDRWNMVKAQLEEVKKSAGLKWERNPSQMGESGPNETE